LIKTLTGKRSRRSHLRLTDHGPAGNPATASPALDAASLTLEAALLTRGLK